MAQVDIGKIKIVWKGAWNSSTAYTVDDAVSHSGSSYICIQAGTNQNPSSATAYWQVMASAGTNGTDGTDVGATLANKEIAFKTNAGAVDGIPIGNAGEFLKVNSGATGYEYGAVSSDFVKLATADSSGNPASIFFSDVFTSDYTTYQLFVDGAAGSQNTVIHFRFTLSGTTEKTSGYIWGGSLNYFDHSSGGSAGDATRRHHNYGTFPLVEENGGTDQLSSCYSKMTIYNPRQSSEYRWISSETGLRSTNSNYFYMANGHGYNTDTSNVFQGIRLFPGAGVFNSGRFTLYGIK